MNVLIIIVLGILSLSYFILISSKPAIWSTLYKMTYETQNVIPISTFNFYLEFMFSNKKSRKKFPETLSSENHFWRKNKPTQLVYITLSQITELQDTILFRMLTFLSLRVNLLTLH